MKRSRGSGVSGNGNGVRPMLGNVSRQDLDRLFDDPSHPVIPLRGVLAPPTGEAATLFGDDELVTDFEDDEVASLFEESTSDSVPNALVPSRLKPCRKVIISPTSRKALGPVSRPSRSRRSIVSLGQRHTRVMPFHSYSYPPPDSPDALRSPDMNLRPSSSWYL